MRQIDIPERERSIMLQMLGLKQDQELPEAVNDAYWRTKQVSDSVSHYFSDSDLMWIVMSSGGWKRFMKPVEKTVAELFLDNTIRYGHKVFCRWRGQSREASIVGVLPNGKVQVRYIGKTTVYEMDVVDVSLKRDESVKAVSESEVEETQSTDTDAKEPAQ